MCDVKEVDNNLEISQALKIVKINKKTRKDRTSWPQELNNKTRRQNIDKVVE